MLVESVQVNYVFPGIIGTQDGNPLLDVLCGLLTVLVQLNTVLGDPVEYIWI